MFLRAALPAAISCGPLVSREPDADAKTPAKQESGWIKYPKGCFDPKHNISCNSRAPHRLGGTDLWVHGGAGWHFYDSANPKKKKPIYGLWIEEEVENGNRVETELAIPLELVPVELHRAGVKGRVVWDATRRSVKVTLGEHVFEYRFRVHDRQPRRRDQSATADDSRVK